MAMALGEEKAAYLEVLRKLYHIYRVICTWGQTPRMIQVMTPLQPMEVAVCLWGGTNYCIWSVIFAFGVSFHLNLQSQSPWSLFNEAW